MLYYKEVFFPSLPEIYACTFIIESENRINRPEIAGADMRRKLKGSGRGRNLDS